MYRFRIFYRHPTRPRFLGIYWGSRGSVLDAVYSDFPSVPMDMIEAVRD